MQTQRLHKKQYHSTQEYAKEAYSRKNKLNRVALLLQEGCSEEVAFMAVEVSRATYYRWKKSYRTFGLAGLEDARRRPNNTRKPHWTHEVVMRVYHLRKEFPLWGKQKIMVMYKRKYSQTLSESTVGRIITRLIKQEKVHRVRFMLYRKTEPKKRIFNNHAQRWKHGMKALNPGELIQVDHMTVYVPGFGYVKHFSATCSVTKYTVYQIYQEATSKNAAEFLQYMRQSFPFSIQSIQVDGGSEFMAHFESACKTAHLPLFVLPPRSPELNGNVERSNSRAKYEFYAQYTSDPSLHIIRKNLRIFVDFYNTQRPHQGIGLLTPAQFYEELYVRS